MDGLRRLPDARPLTLGSKDLWPFWRPLRVVTFVSNRPRCYLIARGPDPFASICGRVCAAPCEAACRRAKIDQPVAIRALKRFVTERFGVESFAANSVWHEAHGPVPPPTLPSVGVFGGGPAGLATYLRSLEANAPSVPNWRKGSG